MDFINRIGKPRFADEWEQEEFLNRQKERYRGDDIIDFIRSCSRNERDGFEDLLFRLVDVERLAHFIDDFLRENRLLPSENNKLLDFYYYTLELQKNVYKELGLE